MSAAQAGTLCAWLEERFCRSTVEIRAYMTAQFDLRYSHSGCVKLLARLGFEYRKPKAQPRVADPAKQAAFIAMYENMLNTLADDEAVYFADAVHPEYQSKPAFGWVKKGANPTLKTTSGRARVNMSYCQIWCLKVLGHAAIWPWFVASIPSLNVTPVMTLAR